MYNREFTAAWQGLSPIQREAAQWDEGPLLLLASPRSGTAKVLTCRMARILDSSRAQKFRIICITFSHQAASEIIHDVSHFVPRQEDRLLLGTFHSFCEKVLRQHGIHLKIKSNFRVHSQNRHLQMILNDAVEKAKKRCNLVSDADKTTLPVIQHLKSFLILPEQCREAFVDQRFAERMAVVYPAYEAELAERNVLDFNSLILKTYQLFTKYPILAKRYRTVYRHICIDRFQEITIPQYKIIRAITVDQYTNLFMIVDDEQTMYQREQGQRIMDFRNDYSPTVMLL